MERFTGGCLCGDVRIEATVTVEGETGDYNGRCFCPRCGSSVFSRGGGEIDAVTATARGASSAGKGDQL